MTPTTITIPANTLSPHQLAAIIAHVEASLPYYQQGGVTLRAKGDTRQPNGDDDAR